MDDEDEVNEVSTQENKKALLYSFVTATVVIVFYTAIDIVHRALIVYGNGMVCSELQGGSVCMPRDQFWGYTEDNIIYARNWKLPFCQLVQDFTGGWCMPFADVVDAGISIEKTDASSGLPLYNVVAIGTFVVLIMIVILIAKQLSKKFRLALNDYKEKGMITFLKEEAAAAKGAAKAALTGILIVASVIIGKLYGRIFYHFAILIIICVAVITLFACAVACFTMRHPSIKEPVKDAMRALADALNSVIEVIPKEELGRDEYAGFSSRIATTNEALGKMLEKMQYESVGKLEKLATIIGLAPSTVTRLLTVIAIFTEKQLTNEWSLAVKQLGSDESAKGFLKAAISPNADGLGMRYVDPFQSTKSNPTSPLGFLWLLVCDILSSPPSNEYPQPQPHNKCMDMRVHHTINMDKQPVFSLLKFVLFEKTGTRAILYIITLMLLIDSLYKMFHIMVKDQPNDDDAMDGCDDTKCSALMLRKTSGVIVGLSLFVVVAVTIIVMIGGMVKNYAMTTTANKLLKLIADQSKHNVVLHALYEIITYDHTMDVHSGSPCVSKWLWLQASVANACSLFKVAGMGVIIGCVVSLGYATVYFTDLKRTTKQKQMISSHHFANVHKTFVMFVIMVISMFMILVSGK